MGNTGMLSFVLNSDLTNCRTIFVLGHRSALDPPQIYDAYSELIIDAEFTIFVLGDDLDRHVLVSLIELSKKGNFLIAILGTTCSPRMKFASSNHHFWAT